jgi:hypothetical protein
MQDGIPFVPADVDSGGPGHAARASRIQVNSLVMLIADSVGVEATACDVSQNGLKIEATTPLEPGPITIKLPGFPMFSGEVRWRDANHIGIQFRHPISWEYLTAWVKAHGAR